MQQSELPPQLTHDARPTCLARGRSLGLEHLRLGVGLARREGLVQHIDALGREVEHLVVGLRGEKGREDGGLPVQAQPARNLCSLRVGRE